MAALNTNSIALLFRIGWKAKFALEPSTPIRRSLFRIACNMQRPGLSLPPPRWDASPSQGYPLAFHQASLTIHQHPFVLLGGEGHCESKCWCFAQSQVSTRSLAHKPWGHCAFLIVLNKESLLYLRCRKWSQTEAAEKACLYTRNSYTVSTNYTLDHYLLPRFCWAKLPSSSLLVKMLLH